MADKERKSIEELYSDLDLIMTLAEKCHEEHNMLAANCIMTLIRDLRGDIEALTLGMQKPQQPLRFKWNQEWYEGGGAYELVSGDLNLSISYADGCIDDIVYALKKDCLSFARVLNLPCEFIDEPASTEACGCDNGTVYTMPDETEIGQSPGSSGITCPDCDGTGFKPLD